MAKPKCKAKTKAGKRCKGHPLAVTGYQYCMAHAPAEIRERSGFVAKNGKQGRPKLPTPTEIARRVVEENVAAILRPHFKALGLDLQDDGTVKRLPAGAIVVYKGKPTPIEDLGAQIEAAEKLLDRVYGRPKQSTELSGPKGEPIELVEVPTDAEFQREVAAILRGQGAA